MKVKRQRNNASLNLFDRIADYPAGAVHLFFPVSNQHLTKKRKCATPCTPSQHPPAPKMDETCYYSAWSLSPYITCFVWPKWSISKPKPAWCSRYTTTPDQFFGGVAPNAPYGPISMSQINVCIHHHWYDGCVYVVSDIYTQNVDYNNLRIL